MNIKCYLGRHRWQHHSTRGLPSIERALIIDQCDRCALRRGKVEVAR